MSNNDGTSAFAGLLWIITIAISIGAGVLSWNWVEPKSFIGALGFLILWGVLSKVGHLIAMGIVFLIGSSN